MIDIIVREIRQCLENDIFVPSLISALTLPDICGRAQHPNWESGRRYVAWYDENIYAPEVGGLPNITGTVAYSLRCSLLHLGNPQIALEKLDIQSFELVAQPADDERQFGTQKSMECVIGGDGVPHFIKNRKISIGIRHFCHLLCDKAEKYYKEHKEKFIFFNYTIVDGETLDNILFDDGWEDE